MSEPTSAPIEIKVDRAANEATVVVRGEIDMSTTEQLAAALAGVGEVSAVHVDLGEVAYMDSTGLRTVLAARAELAERGATLDVVAVSNIVGRLIEITGLDDLVSTLPAD